MVTADKLTLDELTEVISEASGWGASGAAISFRRTAERNGSTYVSVAVEICGAKTSVSATAYDHHSALVALLVNIESHHRQVMEWHKARCARARELLNKHEIYYVKAAI